MTKTDPCWVVLTGAAGKFANTVKAGVRPHSYRKWDQDHRLMIHWKWLKWVVDLARQHYDYVDYSQLPTTWQMAAAGASVASEKGVPEVATNPFATLYVTEGAPTDVVKAAYKALSLIHHPDVGGDVNEFKKIGDAYKKVMEIKCS